MLNSLSAGQLGFLIYTDYGTSIAITDCSTYATGSIVIPETIDGKPVIAIGNNAFYEHHDITSVTIPGSVTSIGNNAFNGCRGLRSVNIPDGLTSIGEAAFHLCPIGSVTIPSSLTTVGRNAFSNCSLTSLTIQEGVEEIRIGAFRNNGLTRVSVPSSVTHILDFAFANANMLTASFAGAAPEFVDGSSFGTASGFTVYYKLGATGFTTPSWKGFHAFPGAPPQFTSNIPSVATVGFPFIHTCTVTGTPTSVFGVGSGALPPGLVLSESGVISGIPTAEAIYSGTVAASNGIGPDATQAFSLDTRGYRILVASGIHGTTSGGGSHPLGATITLGATPTPGYLFANWTGDATSSDNPLSVLMDSDKTVTATFGPDTADDDEDGLTNYQEIVEIGSNPNLPNTDGDTADDGDDAFPLDPAETLDTDGDGTGDNADLDDDGDGLPDVDELTVYGTNPKRSDSDGDGLNDKAELEIHFTNPLNPDHDGDGLSDGAEFLTHFTNPKVADSDGDGFLDGYEVLTGKLPLDPLDKPALVAEARTAIEFTFSSALGKTYRIEGSTDLSVWTTVESGIAGNGGQIQRFYTIRNLPKRYFRVEEEAP